MQVVQAKGLVTLTWLFDLKSLWILANQLSVLDTNASPLAQD